MRNIKMRTIILALGLTLCLPNIIKAQNSVAKVDINRLIDEHPKKDEYHKKLDELSKEYQQELEDMSNKLLKTLKKYEDEVDLQTEATNIKRGEEIQTEKGKISEFQEIAVDDLIEEETYLNKKMNDDILSAVSNVAKKQNLDFVIDSSSEHNIINADCENIFNDVKEELIKIIAEKEKRSSEVIGTGFGF